MKIFSEIYSTYYRITEAVLKRKTVTRAEIMDIICRNGYSESMLFLGPKLTDPDNCGLLTEAGGVYRSILKKEPSAPLTVLEKSWLCSVINDRKSDLFLNKNQKDELYSLLGGKKLYDNDYIYFFDRFSDGDNYQNENYIRHFRNILRAFREHRLMKISFQTRKNNRVTHYYLPVRLEYSSKNDRFRVQVIRYHKNRPIDTGDINLSQITVTEVTDTIAAPGLKMMRAKKEVTVKISDERNAVNRFMMEFAELERRSEYDEKTKACIVVMKYNQKDETEILIRILSFGPTVEVIGPEDFRNQIRKRVEKQLSLSETV